MTTVLSVGNSEGERRCTAVCHDAHYPECDCVCEGRYHGKGSPAVIAQVQQDVASGIFGETIAVDRPAVLRYAKERRPDVVRYHRREVVRARHDQRQLELRADEIFGQPA